MPEDYQPKITPPFNSLLLLRLLSFMLVKQDAVKLLEAFNASVTGLLREISDKLEVIEKNDPDPDRTSAHAVDKSLRDWFHKGGYMGY